MPDLFQLGFMVRAFIAGGIVGVICPLLGTFVVLRRLSLIADALAHVALAGAAVGLLLNRYPLVFALMVSALAALVLEWLRGSRRLAGDTALAVVLYSALAVAVVILSAGQGLNVNLLGYLFGSIVTAGDADVWATVALGAAVLVLVGLLYTELVQSTFDPVLAKISGVPVGRVNTALAVLTGVTVTLSMRVVGALLVGALIVFPTVASLQLGLAFRATLLVAAFLGLASVCVGLVISYYQDVAPGGVIVLTSVAIVLITTSGRMLATRLLRPPSPTAPADPPRQRQQRGRLG